jgi:hypothetical protein
MTNSQSDVDKVMAAFGAAPIKYRPNQDAVAASGGRIAAPSPAMTDQGAAPPAPTARAEERILPGAGGHVREVFPLLWRAVPTVGELQVGTIKRPGDEVPEAWESREVADQVLPARPQSAAQPSPDEAPVPVGTLPRVVPFVAADARPSPLVAGEGRPRVAAWPLTVRSAPGGRTTPLRGDTAAVEQSPAQWDHQAQRSAQAAPPPAPPMPAPLAALPPKPLPPLRSHAELIRPIAQRTSQPAPLPAATQPDAQTAAAPQPYAPQTYAPESFAPQPAGVPPMPPQAAPAAHPAAHPAPAASPQGYPQGHASYYPAPALPPPGMQQYPMHPGAPGWPQPGYPPPYGPSYAPGYPPPGAGYPPGYGPAYPPPFPYGYPQQPSPAGPQDAYSGYPPGYPPPYSAPPPYPLQPQPQQQQPQPQAMQASGQHAGAPPAENTAGPPPVSLSDIFAALHRAPRGDRGEETSQ